MKKKNLIFYCLLIVNTLAGTLSPPQAGKPQNNPGLTGLNGQHKGIFFYNH